MFAQIRLTVFSILVLVLFFNIPTYSTWLTGNLLHPENELSAQYSRIDEEARREYKYGGSYAMYKQLMQLCKTSLKIDSPVVLLPPSALVEERKIPNFVVVEPCIFYYLTGSKAVWYDSPGVEKANVALVVSPKNQLVLQKIQTKGQLNQILAFYKTYKLDL